MLDVRQVGQDVACPACGESRRTPSLREIRQYLKRAPDSDHVAGSNWSSSQGALFGAGVLVTVMGLVLTIWAGVSWLTVEIPPRLGDDAKQVDLARIDDLNPSEAWDTWQDIRQEPIGHYQSSPRVVAEYIARINLYWMFAGLGVTAVGVLCCGGVLASCGKRLGAT